MTDTTTTGDQAKERLAAIIRYPRTAALISGALVPITAAVNLFALKDMSWPLLGVTVISALVCILALWNVANFSPAAVARLEALSPQVDGKFSLWKPGTGGYEGMPFAHGLDFQRFGMLSYALHGAPVEIGHLASQLTARFRAPTGRRHAYVVVRLPERLPHMIVSFGHLSRVLGVRMAPEQWHRSQRVDVGGGRQFRLYVADGGEQLARTFFSPEMVQMFQRVGRYYDIEMKGRNLYLFSGRSAAAGSDRRWHEQRALIEDLAASIAGSRVWELVRRQSRGRGPAYADLRADVARTVAIVCTAAGVAIVVLSFIALRAAGLLE